jgi:hypothetical protein
MATPATRTPIKLARGSYSNLNNSIDDLQQGEIVYATDQDVLYVKEGSSLVAVSGTTNLSNTANGTSLTVESSSGNNTALPAATTSAWGVMTDEDKTKLDGIASSANNYTHPNHSGEVTSTNDGATVIASNIVDEDNLKISNAPSDGKFLQYKDGTDELTWAVPTDTNTQLTTEAVQDIVGAMFTGNTETNIAATYEDSDGTIDLVADNDNTQLTTEQVQDIVGGMFTGNTETNITATYQDGDGTIDLVSTDTNTQLTTEEVQDIVGAMVDGGTETRIGVTYDDTSGKLNFVVDDQSTDNNTTYSISCVDGDSADEEKIRLTDSGAGTDDVVLEAGTGLSIARDGDKITFTNTVSDTNTQLTTEEVQDIVGGMFTGNTETNISATYEDGDGTIDLVSTNTTYGVVDSSANGLAPQLPGSHGGKFLKADGSWEVPPDTNTQVAIDDTPVNGVTDEAISSNWAYDHNAATGNSAHVPAAGSSGEFLAHNGAWATPADATKMPLAGGTFTGSVTFEDAINENVFAITDAASPVLEPNNGMIQTWTLNTGSISGDRTPSNSIAAGQSMLLMVDDGDGSDAITWPSTTWVGGSSPSLATSGWTVIELWNVGGTLYAAHVGDVA